MNLSITPSRACGSESVRELGAEVRRLKAQQNSQIHLVRWKADREKAFAFYRELFGWQKAEADTGAVGTYQMFSAGGQTIGGMFTKPAMEPVPFWLYYFNVADIDEATRRVKAGGGRNRQRANRSLGQPVDPAMHGPAGRTLRAGGKAQPQRDRLFRARCAQVVRGRA